MEEISANQINFHRIFSEPLDSARDPNENKATTERKDKKKSKERTGGTSRKQKEKAHA